MLKRNPKIRQISSTNHPGHIVHCMILDCIKDLEALGQGTPTRIHMSLGVAELLHAYMMEDHLTKLSFKKWVASGDKYFGMIVEHNAPDFYME